ncbi:MAG: KpsF/GutQ family sugar-phosphate isomerase [Fusobacteriaceae bacterium]|nr:KpsF/GutQ family sugar-phosphate isomerase [Fusobacteriaceae bacterium]MBN2837938.1 KpsF/GutQ family sugar-phosphate isomerase [Fusobacteriaceae bacterium]
MEIIARVKEVFQKEIDEVIKVRDRVGIEVEKCIRMILETKGKVVITGVGKSGHIGKKLAATFSSTGTLTIFMHSTEGLHGDLGMVHEDDLIIAISHSGNTEEVMSIMPSIKKIGCKVVAMTGNKESKLAKEADCVLDIGVEEEACSLNLAPTSSSTATLMMGDAIAITLMEIKKFMPEDFALYHPGGSLGRRLLLKVTDIMHKVEEIALCEEKEGIDSILLKMTNKNLGAACIIKDDKIVGIITEGDIRRALKNKEKFFEFEAKDIMTSTFKSVKDDAMAIEAMQIMEKGKSKIYQLPVIDNEGKLVGLVRLHDLVS